jgi:hypothetical protein
MIILGTLGLMTLVWLAFPHLLPRSPDTTRKQREGRE